MINGTWVTVNYSGVYRLKGRLNTDKGRVRHCSGSSQFRISPKALRYIQDVRFYVVGAGEHFDITEEHYRHLLPASPPPYSEEHPIPAPAPVVYPSPAPVDDSPSVPLPEEGDEKSDSDPASGSEQIVVNVSVVVPPPGPSSVDDNPSSPLLPKDSKYVSPIAEQPSASSEEAKEEKKGEEDKINWCPCCNKYVEKCINTCITEGIKQCCATLCSCSKCCSIQ